MIKAVIIAIVLQITSYAVMADEPPSWESFEVKSPNNRFVAEVKVKPGQEKKAYYQKEYELTVYEVNETRRRKLWWAAYRYDGYPGGILANDGATFAYVNHWYYKDAPVVMIYRVRKDVKVLNGSAFDISPTHLQETASHQLWLSYEPRRSEFYLSPSQGVILQILTIDKKVHQIDVETGLFLK